MSRNVTANRFCPVTSENGGDKSDWTVLVKLFLTNYRLSTVTYIDCRTLRRDNWTRCSKQAITRTTQSSRLRTVLKYEPESLESSKTKSR
jgi:hypothetical protein